MNKKFFDSALTIFIISLIAIKVSAAASNISGTVRDAKTGEALVGANIILEGTSMGTATDLNGKYSIHNVIPGTYVISTTYIGYKSEKIRKTIKEGEKLILNFSLEPVSLKGKEVVVTAQASGQTQAINQQLSSNQIINVVSAAKIQELPDANAAESVGRLPGVSLLRSGGEADYVVIRGLQPKYNEITIDGIKISSADANNRSTDLSMISSNMLEGIQVSKTVTPDMNADVLGGTVNFELREAKVKAPGVPVINLLVQGGYNNLPDAYNRYNNYKYVGSVEDRFFNDKLGIFAQADVERKNLSSNELGATYDHLGNSTTQYITTGLSLADIPRDRQRYNGALVIDYKLPEGSIKLSNFFSTGTTDAINRSEYYDIAANVHNYNLTHSNSTLDIITNGLNLKQQLSIFQLDAKLSHTYSSTKDPASWTASFMQSSAGINQFNNMPDVNPQSIPLAANSVDSLTTLNTFYFDKSFTKQQAYTASLDLKTNYSFSDNFNTEIKFGGMFRYQTRYYNTDEFDGQLVGYSLNNSMIYPHFSLQSDGSKMTYWVDRSFSYGKFLNGDYAMHSPLNYGMLSELADLLNNNLKNIADQGFAAYYGQNNYASTTNDYSGFEKTGAFYIMAIAHIGQEVTIIPGVRYQNLQTTYTGARGMMSPESYFAYNHYDTTVTQNHGYWLPDINIRYKPVSWFDVRLSYTSTLAYPDFNAIVPRINVGNTFITWNNYQLVPSRSKNYDAYFSFYDNSIGLFTAGAFLKQIDNLIYPWSFYVPADKILQYYPFGLLGSSSKPKGTYNLSTYENNPYVVNDYGVELDWQTHFWYLPEPFSGLVFNINYTHIFSKAQYPYTYLLITSRSIKYIDTSFTDRLIYQPDNILNVSFGFDYKDFSIRIAMLYQSDIFTGPNFWPQLRAQTSASTRWDVSIKQGLPWYGVQLFANINNITGAKDVSIIPVGGVPTSEQYYDLTAELGLKWQF